MYIQFKDDGLQGHRRQDEVILIQSNNGVNWPEMKNVKVALMPDNTCAFSCFPCLTILPMKQCGSDFSDLGFSFPFEIQHHFWNNNSH